jgi:hypothetical protein
VHAVNVERRWIAGAALALTAIALVCRHDAPTRVAIRVACDERACALAEALALDVWSEERGPGMPLDVVVSSSALDELAAAHVTWQVLVPDIDAVARAETERLHAARPGDWFADYRDYTAIAGHLHELAELAPDRSTAARCGHCTSGTARRTC